MNGLAGKFEVNESASGLGNSKADLQWLSAHLRGRRCLLLEQQRKTFARTEFFLRTGRALQAEF
jgi:hypothetical protein